MYDCSVLSYKSNTLLIFDQWWKINVLARGKWSPVSFFPLLALVCPFAIINNKQVHLSQVNSINFMITCLIIIKPQIIINYWVHFYTLWWPSVPLYFMILVISLKIYYLKRHIYVYWIAFKALTWNICIIDLVSVNIILNLMIESFYFTDDNIDETYGVNVQFEESEDEVL